MPISHPAANIESMISGLESPLHLLILLLLLLLVFGPKRLPEMGRSLGTSMREFKDSLTKPASDGPTRTAVAPPEDNEISDGR